MKNFITHIKSCCSGATTKNSIALCFLLITISLSSFAQISRTQIMSNANSYSNGSFSWTATAANKWWGTYCGGKYIYYANPSTGGCVITGTNWGMPYSWGGWSTISQHHSAMSSGKSAGFICSSSGGGCNGGGVGTSCASGMDCSGYVSRVWQLSSRRSTYDLDVISTPINASQVQHGDIYNLANSHVRLLSSVSGSGSITVLEASSIGWRVQSSTYTPAALSSYTPRLFNNSASCGTPTSVFVSAITPTSVTINWTGSGVINYTYFMKTSIASKYTAFGTYSNKPVTFTGLIPGTTYNFKVAANCSNGTWGISSAISFTTPTSFAPTGSNGTLTVSDGATTTRIGIESSQFNEIKIFPNPVKAGHEISIEGLSSNCMLSIYTMEGKLMFSVTAESGSTKFKLPANLPASIYLFNIKSENFTFNRRLVVLE